VYIKMGPIRRSWNWIKLAWERQPVLFVATVMGILGPAFVVLSPGTKKTYEEIENWPIRYKISKSTKQSS
jgi:hypothetical protein